MIRKDLLIDTWYILFSENMILKINYHTNRMFLESENKSLLNFWYDAEKHLSLKLIM